jgi:O-antigen ligase
LLRALPAALLIAAAGSLAWFERGSIVSRDWLGYAILAALLLATVLATGRVYVPARLPLAGTVSLLALVVWNAISLVWSPLPTLGRDEVFLVALYALVFSAAPLLTRGGLDRTLVVAALVVGVGVVAVAAALELRAAADEDMFRFGRLKFPITYVNANGAFFAVAVWPALALAALRGAPTLVRAVALGAAGAALAGWLATQSKGAALGLAVSAVFVFAIAPARLRLLVPTVIAGVAAGVAYSPLTAPFRAEEGALEGAARQVGTAWLLVTGATFAAGVAYALADRQVTVGARGRRVAGAAVLAAVAVAAVAAAGAFFVAVDDPAAYVERRLTELKGTPAATDSAPESSHFETLESERYDVWRVAAGELAAHPVAGIGARGFYAAYLEHGRTLETPARAHSLPLDVFSETGIVGLLLLLVAVGAPLVAAARHSRLDPVVAGATAACVYWLVHAAVDWIWTVPANGIAFFALLGVAAAGPGGSPLAARGRAAALATVAATTLVLFAPAWLATRYIARALQAPPAAASADLARARRLDPISTSPLVVEAQLAGDPARRVAVLRRAVEREPRSAGLRLLLGVAYRDAGRPADARRELEAARRLAPRDEGIERVLRGGR